MNPSRFSAILYYTICISLLYTCKEPIKIENPVSAVEEKDSILTNIVSKKIVAPFHTDTLTFIEYNDDGDYFYLYAENDKELFGFINDKNEDRSYLRGDIIEVNWKKDSIYIAGDGEAAYIADWVVSTKKLKDGKSSNFRKTYKKQLKYNWSKENNYTESFRDQLYQLVEYYIANSQNELIKSAVANKEQLEYSIEEQKRDGKEYTMIGIATISEHKTNTIQWLFYEYTDARKLYEYDLQNDKLIEFK